MCSSTFEITEYQWKHEIDLPNVFIALGVHLNPEVITVKIWHEKLPIVAACWEVRGQAQKELQP